MIDRQARELLVAAIDSYLNEEIELSAFNHAVFAIAAATPDAAAHYVAETVSDTYDDAPHRIEAWDWNCLQRIRLVLLSDCEMFFQKESEFGRRYVALACLAFIIATAWLTGNSPELHLVCLLSGMLLYGVGSRELDPNPYYEIVFPFDSVRQLANVYRQTPGFRKQRIPRAWRRKSSEVRPALVWLVTSIAHALFMPLIVLFECFPSGTWRVVESSEFQPA